MRNLSLWVYINNNNKTEGSTVPPDGWHMDPLQGIAQENGYFFFQVTGKKSSLKPFPLSLPDVISSQTLREEWSYKHITAYSLPN